MMLTAFSVHKFYMGFIKLTTLPIKMLQITSRIFIDDLNKALEKNTIESISHRNRRGNT
jgi:hypothetical protein